MYEKLKKDVKARIKPVTGIIEGVRECKDAGEVRAISRAAKIAWEGLSQTLGGLEAGMTESQAAGLLDFQICNIGGRSSFDTIVAFGANASRPHHQPGRKKLKTNDTILIDFGAKYKGYCSDLTRCFVFGAAGKFYHKVYLAVLEAQRAAIKVVAAGVKMSRVDSAAREVLVGYDLPLYGHGTGHGLGLEVHEKPVVASSAKGTLRAGEVITIEPGVYIPGKLGVRIEDDVLVTESGCKILSADKRFGFSKASIPILRSR